MREVLGVDGVSDEPLWTIAVCCVYRNCARNTLRGLVGRGEIPYGRLGPSGHLRFDPTMIRDWFQRHGVDPEEAAERKIRAATNRRRIGAL